MSVINALPNLVDLEFCGDTFKKDDIIQFLMTNKRLQTVRVAFIDMPHWPDFLPAIESKWILVVYCGSEITDIDRNIYKLDRIGSELKAN